MQALRKFDSMGLMPSEAPERRERRTGDPTALQTLRITRTGVIVAIVIGLLTVPLGLWQVLKKDGPDLASAGSQFVRLSPNDAAVWVTDRPVSALGKPPRFVPDSGQESHCDDWMDWLPSVGAAPSTGDVIIEVAAPAAAPVVITDFNVSVYKHEAVQSTTLIQCLYGAGGYFTSTGTVDLNRNNPKIEIASESDESGERLFSIPPDQFRVGAGLTELIQMSPKGEPGFYDWAMEARAVIDQKSYSVALGTKDKPLRTFIAPEDMEIFDSTRYIDWHVDSCQWGPPPAWGYDKVWPAWSC